MHNRNVIITGANSGIGKAAAIQFATKGYTIIMACRNLEISKAVQTEIIKTANNRNIHLMKADMSSFHSIENFCKQFKSKFEKADIIIHNAAYFNHGEKYQLSSDQIELTFATNVFGPFLMTALLMDHLKKSDDARILFAGSSIIKHFFDEKTKIHFDNLRGEFKENRSHRVYKMYCQSKMALLLLTFKLAGEYQEDGIKVNMLQINGAKMSKQTIKKVKPWWRPIALVQNLFFPPAAYMANNYYEICSSDAFRNTTGKLINDKLEIMQPAPSEKLSLYKQLKQIIGSSIYPLYAENIEVREQLWKLCKKLTDTRTLI